MTRAHESTAGVTWVTCTKAISLTVCFVRSASSMQGSVAEWDKDDDVS